MGRPSNLDGAESFLYDHGSAVERARDLNAAFARGESVWTPPLLSIMSVVKNPIVVDFNGVLVNNSEPLVPNPKARSALEALRTVGTIAVVTVAGSHRAIRQELEADDLWYPEMILMTREVYTLVGNNGEDISTIDLAREREKEFKLRGGNGSVQEKQKILSRMDVAKRIAPIFMSALEVPILDDTVIATYDNPGMLGIYLETFDGAAHDASGDKSATTVRGVCLQKAVEMVMNHYQA